MATEAKDFSATSAAFDKSEIPQDTASGGRKMTTPVVCPPAPRFGYSTQWDAELGKWVMTKLPVVLHCAHLPDGVCWGCRMQ